MDYQQFVRAELLILIPVLYLIGVAIKKSNIRDNLIPVILGVCGILLSGLYLFTVTPLNGSVDVATLLFSAITQGILCAGASVYANQIYKQAKEQE